MITRKRLVLRKKDDGHAPQLLGLATASMMKYRACCATTEQMADRPTSRTYAVSAKMMGASDTKPCVCMQSRQVPGRHGALRPRPSSATTGSTTRQPVHVIRSVFARPVRSTVARALSHRAQHSAEKAHVSPCSAKERHPGVRYTHGLQVDTQVTG